VLNLKIHQFSSCTCMNKLVDIDHATGFMVYVGILTKGEQDTIMKEWIVNRKSTRGEGGYSLNIGVDKAKTTSSCFVECQRSHDIEYLGVILISRYPNAIGMPTKSGRRTAAKTQT
jgi:hypothetical protein